jgi:4-alpha-glucanotransferase
MSNRQRAAAPLRAVARLYGIQSWYLDAGGTRRYASDDALRSTLSVLGVDATGDVRALTEAALHRRRELAADGVEPVHVAWNGRLPRVELRDATAARDALQINLRLESGAVHSWRVTAEPVEQHGIEPAPACFHVPIGEPLPLGYHRLEIESATDSFEAMIIAAPRHAPTRGRREWGVFAPLYALRSASDWGVGDFADLQRLGEWATGLGAGFVSTLPLLATFLDAPFEPSPYAPASRLFWNELFLDVTAAGASPTTSDELRVERTSCRAGDLVDYRGTAALKRRALRRAAIEFFSGGGSDSDAFRRFVGANPEVERYARFRAVGERQRTGWHSWPERLRRGELRAGDYSEEDARYHVFVQFEADRQLTALTSHLDAHGATLYLDLPLGVHGDSYDVWRNPELFALGASAGAPPDALFSGGQSWGFPPLRPDALRRHGYAYLLDAVRHHLRHAGMLRLDHVMALRRLYWIPPGCSARDGVYVRYPANEWLAILTLEATRHGATIVGEDLGTVPREVRQAMDRHRLQRMYVVQFEANADSDPPIPRVPEPVIASLNTHDMPTFAAYWAGIDIEDQKALGLVDDAGVAAKKHGRAMTRRAIASLLKLPPAAAEPDGAGPALRALLGHLAASDARAVLVNLEDLWLEARPQNVPGTSSERPNWRRRMSRTLEELMEDRDASAALEAVDRRRNGT